jgi:hypothetical protein
MDHSRFHQLSDFKLFTDEVGPRHDSKWALWISETLAKAEVQPSLP